MTQIRVDKFCSLAHSPSWQAWLYHFDSGLYYEFSERLRKSKGCSGNTDLMIDTLKRIDSIPHGSDKLLGFLRANYAYMLVNETSNDNVDEIFGYYNPAILTYPRRLVMTGSQTELQQRLSEFSTDKLKVEHIIIGEKLYIEYLTNADSRLVNQIPQGNWKITSYKLAKNL